MTPHTTAIRQAAEEIDHLTGDDRVSRINVEIFEVVIARHLAPLLEHAERENQTLRAAFAVADDQSEHCQSLVAGLEQERDQALARAEQAEKERDKALTALVFAINQTDAKVTESCSIDFLCDGWREIEVWAKNLRARAAAADGERDRLRFELDGMEVVRRKDNAYLIEQRDTALAKLAACEAALRALSDSTSHLIHCAKHFASDDRLAPTEAHNLFYAVDDAQGDLDAADAHLSNQEPAP